MNWEDAARRIQAIPRALDGNSMRALVKFDGQRDDGRIYTVVLDRCDHAGPASGPTPAIWHVRLRLPSRWRDRSAAVNRLAPWN